MQSKTQFIIGQWHVDGPGCRIESDGTVVSLEPKVMDLLLRLAAEPNEVVGRETLLSALWPGVIVGEDTLARAVSKLRNALGDDAKQSRYVETIPKRGYRLIAPIAEPHADGASNHSRWVLVAASLLLSVLAIVLFGEFRTNTPQTVAGDDLVTRADDFYMKFNQPDNAAASALYERALAENPGNALAHAGLASTLVQRVIRYPADGNGAISLTAALDQGLNRSATAEALITRARQLADRGVTLAPQDPRTHKALGLVLSVAGELGAARASYEQAIAIDPSAWEALVNLGELSKLAGRREEAIEYFTRAYESMQILYDEAPQRIGPWHAPLGVIVAQLETARGNRQGAEVWYRRILRLSPYQPDATAGLAQILAGTGDLREALSLCRNLMAVGSRHANCDELISKSNQP